MDSCSARSDRHEVLASATNLRWSFNRDRKSATEALGPSLPQVRHSCRTESNRSIAPDKPRAYPRLAGAIAGQLRLKSRLLQPPSISTRRGQPPRTVWTPKRATGDRSLPRAGCRPSVAQRMAELQETIGSRGPSVVDGGTMLDFTEQNSPPFVRTHSSTACAVDSTALC